jgi:hypothetical protein
MRGRELSEEESLMARWKPLWQVGPKRVHCQVRGKGSRLGEPCQKFRLSQERMPIEPFTKILI